MNTSSTTAVALKSAQLREWYRQIPGRLVAQAERGQLDALFPSLSGKRVVQLGCLGVFNLLHCSHIPHRIVLDAGTDLTEVDIYAHAATLPFDTASIDIVVLPHTLELANHPDEVLSEVNRVLTPDGHLIIIGFNPWGLWRLWRIFSQKPSWCDRFLRLSQIYAWLSALDFRVFHTRYFFFRPPWCGESLLRFFAFFDVLDGWLPFGSLYLTVAQKRIVAMTPIRLRREEIRPAIPDLRWAEPTAPDVNHGQ